MSATAYDDPPREACAGVNPEVMFPDDETKVRVSGGVMIDNAQVRAAKAVCFTCEHLVSCGLAAIERREPIGIWGGMTKRERETVRRRRYPKNPTPRKARKARTQPEELALAV